MPRAFWIIFATAVLALFIGPAKLGPGRALVLAGVEGKPAAMNKGAFTPEGAFSPQAAATLPRGLNYRGSWLGSDTFQGDYETGWYQPKPSFTVMICGYPSLKGNQMEAVFRLADGTFKTLRYDEPVGGEAWSPWVIHSPPTATGFQLRASDHTSAVCGWLAFSEPFTIPDIASRQLWAVVQLIASMGLVLTLIYGPGLLWLHRKARTAADVATAILFGPLLLAALGTLCWALGGWVAPVTVARLGIIVLLGALAWQALRLRAPSALPPYASRVIAAGALLAGFAAAKANVSLGPEGELFGDSVSRTLEVGGHSDSRISYHVAQVIANHLGPFDAEAQKFFSPWNFVSRGPLAGFIAAPIALTTGAQIPVSFPDGTWQPFDAEGFAVYRITLIVLGSLVAWAVFGVTAGLTTPAWGFFAGVVTLLAPFFPHEMYFSWPKLIAAALVLIAFQRLQQRRPLLAGTMLGLGYLFHPLALLSAPFLALWVFIHDWKHQRNGNAWPRGLGGSLLFVTGVMACVIPWQLFGKLGPSGEGQSIFLSYFSQADNRPAHWDTWWQTRWDNFANTFLPFYLLTADPTHESINSFYAQSNAWVRRGFLYWNTLPFALGLPAFAVLMTGIFSAGRRATGVVLITLVGPALLLIVYWGAACTGLMRHCGHGLFVSVIVLGVWGLSRAGAWKQRTITLFLHPACFAWRGAEIALMAFGTTLLHERPDWQGVRGWNDGLSFAIAGICLVAAVIVLARSAGEMKTELLTAKPN